VRSSPARICLGIGEEQCKMTAVGLLTLLSGLLHIAGGSIVREIINFLQIHVRNKSRVLYSSLYAICNNKGTKLLDR
jgi:hypothetical protein